MSDKILVGIVMGSDSDLEIMKGCASQLRALGVGCEMRIISAHRTPDVAHAYSTAAAGGASSASLRLRA